MIEGLGQEERSPRCTYTLPPPVQQQLPPTAPKTITQDDPPPIIPSRLKLVRPDTTRMHSSDNAAQNSHSHRHEPLRARARTHTHLISLTLCAPASLSALGFLGLCAGTVFHPSSPSSAMVGSLISHNSEPERYRYRLSNRRDSKSIALTRKWERPKTQHPCALWVRGNHKPRMCPKSISAMAIMRAFPSLSLRALLSDVGVCSVCARVVVGAQRLSQTSGKGGVGGGMGGGFCLRGG